MQDDPIKPLYTELADLASAKLGAKVLYATDDFFAEKENLIKASEPIFLADEYTDRGKWMDGWESRRRRIPGNDFCIIRLASTGVIEGIDIDTRHFKGNAPMEVSVEGVMVDQFKMGIKSLINKVNWLEILPRAEIDPDKHNFFRIHSSDIFSHIRLQIYPDGGVARLRAYGKVYKNWLTEESKNEFDLASITNGGKVIKCNDMFFGSMDNLIMPDKGVNMGDGWETKRNRKTGNVDWVIIRLAKPGKVHRIIVDTAHFKGNYPDACSIEACYNVRDKQVLAEKVVWKEILSKQKLSADSEHTFTDLIEPHEKISHIRFKIYPDGGVSRLRLYGTI